MKTKRKFSTTVDALVDQVNLAIRHGLRIALGKAITEWAPVWVRSDDGSVWRIERVYGGAPTLTVRLDDLPNDVRQTVMLLLNLLDEQAATARMAMPIARAELGVNATRDRARESSVKERRGATSKGAKARAKAATMIFGDWQQIVVGDWGVIEIATDPTANFSAGIVGVRAMYTCDSGVRHAGAFSVATSIT